MWLPKFNRRFTPSIIIEMTRENVTIFVSSFDFNFAICLPHERFYKTPRSLSSSLNFSLWYFRLSAQIQKNQNSFDEKKLFFTIFSGITIH